MPKSYALLLFFMATTFLVACVQSANQKNNTRLTGQELSKIYCASCHQYPEPAQLPKATWEGHVLPRMGYILENEGGLKVEPHTFPQSTLGRWIVMDAGDLNNDGDIDLALGSLAFEVIPDNGEVEVWVQNGLPFLVLENLAVVSPR